MAQQSARRGWKNQANSERFERAYVIWIRPANSPIQAHSVHAVLRGRTDGSIRLRVNSLKKLLASAGASTDEFEPGRTRPVSCNGSDLGSRPINRRRPDEGLKRRT